MPIYLTPPEYTPAGQDGKGWNRLSLNSHIGAQAAQCALRPRSYPTLFESRDTRRARWGGFGRCSSEARGDCRACPLLNRAPRVLDAFTDRVLVRVQSTPSAGFSGEEIRTPWLMNKPEDGWASLAERWTWEDLATVRGWTLDRQYHDEHGEGFWLMRDHSRGAA